MKNFTDRVAAITGAGSGMGRSLAIQLAREGCHLALADRNATSLAETAQLAQAAAPHVVGSPLRNLALASIKPLPGNPRKHFDEAALDELAASIATRGVIQPIIVRPHGGGFQIIAGERRWRAAQRAGLNEVPVVTVEIRRWTSWHGG